MRKVDGYVLQASVSDVGGKVWWLFGPGKNQDVCSILGNGLATFISVEAAKEARLKLRLRYRRRARIYIRVLCMEITESLEEWGSLKTRKNLVVVSELDGGQIEIQGMYKEGRRQWGYIPGTPIAFNGNIPFQSFDKARYCAIEVYRQAQSRANLATFTLGAVR